MRRIVLFCAGGMSTGMLVKKMEKYAAQIGYECQIEAYGKEMAKTKAPGADIVLIGPQIRFAEKEVRANVPAEIPMFVMEMRDYGAQRADVFIEKCREILGDK